MFDDSLDKLEIAPEDVEVLIAKRPSEVELIDVREDWELVRGVLPGATHIPLSKFGESVDRWTPDRQYVVYCEHGIRSLDVVVWLTANKHVQAKSMRGGFSEWHGEIQPPTKVSGDKS